MATPLVETVGLNKFFKAPGGMLHAVEDINLKIEANKTLGVVGESGCGKSTLGRAILRLTPATSGQVLFEGKNILQYGKSAMKRAYRDMQMIFQDPYSSLNPRMTIYNLISEPMRELYGHSLHRAEMDERVHRIMELCGLPRRHANSYPHELDGGRRQRVGLARAMVIDPKFIVCDEPVSALDVSIQAQILNLLMDLQEQRGLSYMFITHDLCVVRHISDDIMVMYMGQAVEYARKDELFRHPLHPYTKALLSAIPSTNLSRRNHVRHMLQGEVSSPIDPEPGCRFAPRCPHASEKCKEKYRLREVGPGHYVACTMCD
ncbi:MAG TPA: ATP-binding cassette domain-containing protein [Candidatus Pullichristensenella excrementigallinarum]|uniref:ATP-binding cassette domain-containing protein n=1 Tax=Candidatus Pullichristensenella excrementigallinarum TaxID=2840907 RepID=A0A9D1IER9_9FIRM|nr:ATP-binding cassette domain-containing protein [Candidatus Pullichristensenella excrementigallinarum]